VATIVLRPGESFEHAHLEESVTRHVQGTIELHFDGRILLLKEHEEIDIPARIHHVTRNVGKSLAIFDCEGHEVQGPA
jgi:mannose-6-phosphate isomerase-like protein (cupin superfamily)